MEKIQARKEECEDIKKAFYLLRVKHVQDNPDKYVTIDDLPLKTQFAILGEAFSLASDALDGAVDEYHFMWDVVEALLTSNEEREESKKWKEECERREGKD